MDFLKEGIEKLDTKDKIPQNIKDKIPGQDKRGKGQGEHLTQKRDKDDGGGGFPKGLRPESWMGDLIKNNHVPETASVTDFRYPGSHDCATYGSGIESFSYQCQEKNLYEQMKTGQRFFDLRLAQDEGGTKFIPVHGIAKNTADDFNQNAHEAKPNDLASQILKFAKEHSSEILAFQVRVNDLTQNNVKKDFADAVWGLLGNRLLEAPSKGGPVPKYNEAVRSNRNIIWGIPVDIKGHPIEKYIWEVGKNTSCWLGANDQKLWNEPTWQSGDESKVLKSTEEYIHEHENELAKRDKFWVANLQLTPALGQGISTFIKDGGSVRPRDLALGGGIGTHGTFKGSNQELRESGKLESPLWKKTVSAMIYDFCDEKTTGDMVAMNIGGSFTGSGGAGASSQAGPGAHDEHDKPGRGGGRKGKDGVDDDDDDDTPGKRGGHEGGGRGRGGGHQGRGGHHRDD